MGKYFHTEEMVKVSELKAGEHFLDRYGNEYIVLEQNPESNKTQVLTANTIGEMRFGDNNDWRESEVRKYLNDIYLEELRKNFDDEEAIIRHEVDLLSMDGLDAYGKTKDYVSLLTADQYRKYRKTIGKRIEELWWLITPNSTTEGVGANYVRIVSAAGSMISRGAGGSFALRPFFVLGSSTCVKRT